MRVRILPAAKTEIEEAADWYEVAREGLAARFLDELDTGLRRIAEHPNAWHPLSPRVRRYRLNRFPYGIIYHLCEDEVLVVAIAHLHRHPGYWRHRVMGL